MQNESMQSSQTLRLGGFPKHGDIPTNYRVLNNYYAAFRNGNGLKDTALSFTTRAGAEC